MSVPITNGTGASSVAAEVVAGLQYQRIEVLGLGGASVLAVNPDGSINASIIGSPGVRVTGSIAAIVVGGSIVATGVPNQSVSGAVTAPAGSVMTIATLAGSILSVNATAPAGSVMATNQIAGSVMSVSGNIGGSVIAVVQGSITAIPTGNQSISGAVTAQAGSVMTVATLAGSIMAVSATAPAGSVLTVANLAGSIAAVSATAPAGSILSVTNPAGSVTAVSATFAAGSIATVVNPAGSITAVNFANSSIIAITSGSIATVFQGSVITVWQNSSVITIWKDSSVLSVPVGSTIALLQAASIVGTYAEDAASASADKGIFVLTVRNDTMSSVTNADVDYSGISVGPIGEVIIANSPITKWVQGTADFRQGNTGASIVLMATGGTSVFTYITGVQIANMGSASVLVTFASSGSILGYSIAPAGGGSNINYPNALKTPSNGNFAASTSGIASVLVSAQGFISKT